MRTAKGQYYDEQYLSEFSDANDTTLADVHVNNLNEQVAENETDSNSSPGTKNDAGDNVDTDSSILAANLHSLGDLTPPLNNLDNTRDIEDRLADGINEGAHPIVESGENSFVFPMSITVVDREMVKEIHFEKLVTAEDIYNLNLYSVYEKFDVEVDEVSKTKVDDMEADKESVELTGETNQIETGVDLVRKAAQIVEAKERAQHNKCSGVIRIQGPDCSGFKLPELSDSSYPTFFELSDVG